MGIVYTGVGSRQTPQPVCELMFRVAAFLAARNITLRSGGARGADLAFENGCKSANGPREIFYARDEISTEQWEIARRHHPIFGRLNEYFQRLHARNVCQVLGRDLKSNSDFLICYTNRGSGQGGTGQALRIATTYNVPIFDIGTPRTGDVRRHLWDFLIAHGVTI